MLWVDLVILFCYCMRYRAKLGCLKFSIEVGEGGGGIMRFVLFVSFCYTCTFYMYWCWK